MNFSYFISKRISSTKEGGFSAVIHKIAVASIAIGLAIMMLSFLILGGFVNKIEQKNFSFAGHLNVLKFSMGSYYEELPISLDRDFYTAYKKYDFIEHVQSISYKFGLLKTTEGVSGALLKGVGKDFDSLRFSENIINGSFITQNDSVYSKEILISQKMANSLHLKLGDEVVMYFIQKPPRPRKLLIKGIYNTGLEEFDEKIIIGDLALIQKLNKWKDTEVGAFEVYLNDFEKIDEAEQILLNDLDSDLNVEKITDRFVQIFDWLTLIKRQVLIFIGLILFIASFNMASILLILIMERTQMIGLLKALGSSDWQIRKLFIYNGVQIIIKGMLLGNLIGLGIAFLQYQFKIIPLDYENYFMHYVPIQWNWPVVIGVNLLTILIVSAVLVIPSFVISKIQPIKSIKFD